MNISNDALHSIEILTSMESVLSTMPKNVRYVVDPSTFSALIGAPIAWQKDIILHKLRWQMLESGEPPVQKSSK